MAEALLQWRDFYVAVANASAALLGLVYVGASIHAGRHGVDDRVRMLGTLTSQNLIHPLFVSLTMIVPIAATPRAVILLTLAGFGLAGAVTAVRPQTRRLDGDTPAMVAFRYGTPVIAAVVLAAGAVGLLAGSPVGLYAPPVFIFFGFLVGIENAWALLTGHARRPPQRAARRAPQDAPLAGARR